MTYEELEYDEPPINPMDWLLVLFCIIAAAGLLAHLTNDYPR